MVEDFEIVEHAYNAESALDVIRMLQILSSMNGIEVTKIIKRSWQILRCLF